MDVLLQSGAFAMRGGSDGSLPLCVILYAAFRLNRVFYRLPQEVDIP